MKNIAGLNEDQITAWQRRAEVDLELQEFVRQAEIRRPSDEEFDRAYKRYQQGLVSTLPVEQQISYQQHRRDFAQAEQVRLQRKREYERKQAQQAEARRAEQERLVAQDLYDRFRKANPFATQGQIEKLWPALWEAEMVRRMDQPNANMEAERSNPRYSI